MWKFKPISYMYKCTGPTLREHYTTAFTMNAHNMVNNIVTKRYCKNIVNDVVKFGNMVNNIVTALFTILSKWTILLHCVDHIANNLGEVCWCIHPCGWVISCLQPNSQYTEREIGSLQHKPDQCKSTLHQSYDCLNFFQLAKKHPWTE